MPQRGPAGGPAFDHATGTPPTPPTIAEVVSNIFGRYDGDSSGTITLAEILSVLDPNATQTNLATRITSLLTAIDGDADGVLSKDEVTAAVAALDTDQDGSIERSDHLGEGAHDSTSSTPTVALLIEARGPRGGEPPASPTIAQVVDRVFTKVGADSSTTISLSEALSFIDAHDKGVDLSAEVTTLFHQIDADGDGSVSKAELTTAITLLDTDADGTLDRGDTPLNQFDQLSVDLVGVLVHDMGVGCAG